MVNSTSFKAHPGFNENTLENDIALVKLPKPVTLNKYVDIIKIAAESDVNKINLTDPS